LPKDLNDWTPEDVIKWAEKYHAPVVSKLKQLPEDEYVGSTLAGLKEKNFKESFGGNVGSAFYNKLEQQGTRSIRSVP